MEFGDMGDDEVEPDFFDESEDDERNEAELGSRLSELGVQTPNPVLETPPILPDVEMTIADQTVTPETSRKKDKQKARAIVDKQVKNQSTTAKPDAKTSAKNSQKNKKSPDNEVTQILTGYEAVGDEQERIRDIIVYDIPYTWDLQKILAELNFWGTLSSVRGTSAFKIIQTSKGKRKLVGYFKNWETTLKVLDSPPVSLLSGKELKWCQHSIPNLKKARKPKTKKMPDTKISGKAGKVLDSNKSKKKDQVSSSTSNKKNENQLKDSRAQEKAKNTSKSKDRDKGNQVVLAEILSLLRRLV
ncbi:hypothetical protein GLOIN_2v1773465 [Rhizophagus irregularis DAOM 181602=DAOM 197198]|nr:hypothetical protein GLOIN_2v1773465 [Rhizophagus irregularis DAOM 181602=DAOM 197198]